MEIKIKDKELNQMIAKFQQGGAMEGGAPAEAPIDDPAAGGAPAEGGDPMQQLMEMGAQALQTQDCNLAMQFVQIVLQQLGGGGGEAAPAPEGQPVYKKGGRLSYWKK